jgi:hypothetical protein
MSNGLSVLAHEPERSRCPCIVQLVLQSISVSKSSQNGRCRMLNGGEYSQHGSSVVAVALSSAEDPFTVLPDDLETAVPVGGKSWGRVQ